MKPLDMLSTRLVFVMALAVVVASCAPERVTQTEATVQIAEVPPITDGVIYFPMVTPPAYLELKAAMSQEALASLREELADVSLEVYDLSKNGDLELAHGKVKTILDLYEGHPLAFKLQQQAGNLMLRRVLWEEGHSEKLDLVEFYTQILLENKHPDASVLAPALVALQGRWSQARLAAAAAEAFQFSKAYLEKYEKSPSKRLPTNLTEEQLSAKDFQVLASWSALDRLNNLAAAR